MRLRWRRIRNTPTMTLAAKTASGYDFKSTTGVHVSKKQTVGRGWVYGNRKHLRMEERESLTEWGHIWKHMVRVVFRKVGWMPRILGMVGHLVCIIVSENNEGRESFWKTCRPHSRMIREAPIKFDTRLPNDERRTRKFNPRAALLFPKTAAKNRAATPVPDLKISALGTIIRD